MSVHYDIVDCAKCGHANVDILFCRGRQHQAHPQWSAAVAHTEERLHVECKKCGYIWDQKPLDTIKVKQPRL